MATETKVYLPQQKTRRGVAGYRGEGIVVVGDDGKEVKKDSTAAARAARSRAKATAAAEPAAESTAVVGEDSGK